MVQDLAWPMASTAGHLDHHDLWESFANRVTRTLAAQLQAAPDEPHQEAAVSADDCFAAQMSDTDVNTRKAALLTIADMEEWSDVVATLVCTAVLEDPSASVRCQAVEVLASEALRGSRKAIATIVSALQDRMPCVRHTAVEALTGLSLSGSSISCDAASVALHQLDVGCRYRSAEFSIAVEAFGKE